MKEWTIMVYMAGDNNLSLDMAYAVEQIKSVTAKNKKINVYVYFDSFSPNVPTLYCDFSDRQSKFYRSAGIKDKLIKRRKRDDDDVHNENSASMNNMLNFVDWCVKQDRSKNGGKSVNSKYAFIISGHSFGFLDWGLFKDEKADYTMTLSKLRWMVERITMKEADLVAKANAEQERDVTRRRGTKWSEDRWNERTQEILGKNLALLGFDSCVMSTLEIGSQFIDLAETMVASEGSVPNAGWNYAQVLLREIAEGNRSTKHIAMSFVDSFIKAQNSFALANLSVDIAAWDLTQLPALNAKFGAFADSLLKCFENRESVTCQQMKRILSHVHSQCQTYLYEQHVDLGDFCGLLINEISLVEKELDRKTIADVTTVKNRCKKVLEGLSKAVLLSGYSGGDFQYSHGISLFFPWSKASFEAARKDYEKLSFIRNEKTGRKWLCFLEEYLGKVTYREAMPLSATDENGDVIVDGLTGSVRYDSYVLLDEGIYTKPWGGKQPPDDAKQPPDDGKQPPDDGKQPPDDGKQPPDDGKQPPDDGKQPPDDGKQPPDDGKQPPDDGKQPPDDGKQPPDDGKQPPDDARLISGNMSLFLARWMRLKNFEVNWNHAGFTASTEAEFAPDDGTEPSPRKPVRTGTKDEKFVVRIPRGVPIHLTIANIKEAAELTRPNEASAIENDLKALDLQDPDVLKAVRRIGSAVTGKSRGLGPEKAISAVKDKKSKKKLEEIFHKFFPDD